MQILFKTWPMLRVFGHGSLRPGAHLQGLQEEWLQGRNEWGFDSRTGGRGDFGSPGEK